jgi:hypothetical protein
VGTVRSERLISRALQAAMGRHRCRIGGTAGRAVVTLTALCAVAVLGAGCAGTTPRGGEGGTLRAGVVDVDAGHPGPALPGDFLGLSFESSVLGSSLFDPARSNLPALLGDLGTGRLRFGGNSVDRVAAWTASPTDPLPSWAASRVDPDDLARLGALSRATGWKVDLGLTLGHPDLEAVAAEAASARRLIATGLATVQIGNEPDLLGNLRAGYGAADFRSDAAAYRAALTAAAPGVAVSGPDTANPAALASYAAGEGTALATLDQHLYPLSRCGGVKPTIDELLSASTRNTEGRLADLAVAAGRSLGLPVRLDETNSVSCGGQDGVSNTLASALWMVEYLVTVARHGVSGVGVQGGLAACRGYTPLCVPGAKGAAPGTAPGIDAVADASLGAADALGDRLAAQPDFFGLLLVHELEGGQWLPVTANPTTPVWEAAVKMPSGAVRVVIVNPSPGSTAQITIQARGYAGPASVQRLTGPSLMATSGVTLGGAGVGGDGNWRPLPDAPLISQAGSVRVDIPAATAALVTMPAASSGR